MEELELLESDITKVRSKMIEEIGNDAEKEFKRNLEMLEKRKSKILRRMNR